MPPHTPAIGRPLAPPRMNAFADAADRVLVDGARGGNATAFEALVERYQRAVYASAYAVLGDAHAAQDVAQETFLAAFRTLPKLKNPDRPRPWLCGIARNLAVSEVRKRAKGGMPLDRVAEPEAADPFAEADAQAAQADELAAMRTALAGLTQRQREIVTLRYFDGLAYKAIAEALEVSVDVVQVTLFRAKRALAKKMGKKPDRGTTP